MRTGYCQCYFLLLRIVTILLLISQLAANCQLDVISKKIDYLLLNLKFLLLFEMHFLVTTKH